MDRDLPEGEVTSLLAQRNATRASLLAQVSQSSRARCVITLERDFYRNQFDPRDDVAYQLWLERGARNPQLGGPIPAITISIVLSADVTRPDRLQRSLASLAAQSSPNWEALVVVAFSDPDATGPSRCHEDRRVRFVAGSGASRAALDTDGARQATGALVGFLDAGDTLAPGTVEAAARLAASRPGLRIIYTDEDCIAPDGTRSAAVLKSGWSPDLLLSGDALGQLVLFSRPRILAMGGLSAEAGEFARLDLALRLTHDAPREAVAHLPGILFHRGANSAPAAFPRCRTGNGVPRLDAVIDRFLAAHRPGLRRAARQEGSRIWPDLIAALPSPVPSVSIIVPTRDRADLLRACLEALLDTTDYPALQVLLVDNGTTEPAALDLMAARAADPRLRVLRVPGPFGWSALNTIGAAEATGEVLLLLNNDVSSMAPDWLAGLVGHVMRPGIGIVGARLLFSDGTLQHGGVLLDPGSGAVHALAGAARDDGGYLGQGALLRDLSAVTGACLAIRKAVFHEVGGQEQDHRRIAWTDIDLCLRVQAAGYRVLWNPAVTLVRRKVAVQRHEMTLEQNARHEMEWATMRRQWPAIMYGDLYLNPALTAAPGAMLLRTDGLDADEGLPAEAIEREPYREQAVLQRDLAMAEQEVGRLRAAWPWAELQRLQLALEDVSGQLRRSPNHAGRHGGLPTVALALQHRTRPLRAGWRLSRHLLSLIGRTPRRVALLRQRRADYLVIAGSPVFDRAWYRRNVMADNATVDPVSHYLWEGAPAGRNPHALFDAAWYASRVASLGLENPFAHYLRGGMAADADPHPLFDTRFYLSQAPEAAGQALLHYWTAEPGTTRSPALLFDAIENPEGLTQWSLAAEDRDPHALFAMAWYRRTHLGANRTTNPLAHWMRIGAAAGLMPNPHGLGSAWTPLLTEAAAAPSATVVVRPGGSPVQTTRTLISLVRDHTGLPFDLVLVGAGPNQARHAAIHTAATVPLAAAAAKGRYLVFLRSGVVTHEGWFEPLVETADADDGIGMVAPITLDADGALRSAGASLHDSGLVRHEGVGTDPMLPRHRFARIVDVPDGAAMLVRRDAWEAVTPFDIDYGNDALDAAALALVLRAAGWRTVVQPASVVCDPGESVIPAASQSARFSRRWAALLSRQSSPGERNPGWRAADRRSLVLVASVPSPRLASVEHNAVLALLRPHARVVLHATDAHPNPLLIAEWERRGVEVLHQAELSVWLREFGAGLDETVVVRPLDTVPVAELLRWTNAPIRTVPAAQG